MPASLVGLIGGEQSPCFVHLDGAMLAWAVGTLVTPLDVSDTGYLAVAFLVDGAEQTAHLRFNGGQTVATVAFSPAAPLIANVTTLRIRVLNYSDSSGAAGLSVQCRFSRPSA